MCVICWSVWTKRFPIFCVQLFSCGIVCLEFLWNSVCLLFHDVFASKVSEGIQSLKICLVVQFLLFSAVFSLSTRICCRISLPFIYVMRQGVSVLLLLCFAYALKVLICGEIGQLHCNFKLFRLTSLSLSLSLSHKFLSLAIYLIHLSTHCTSLLFLLLIFVKRRKNKKYRHWVVSVYIYSIVLMD